MPVKYFAPWRETFSVVIALGQGSVTNRCLSVQAKKFPWPWADRERIVIGPWADCERTVSRLWSDCERTVSGPWADCERTVIGLWADCERTVIGLWTDCERTVIGPWADCDRTHSGNWTTNTFDIPVWRDCLVNSDNVWLVTQEYNFNLGAFISKQATTCIFKTCNKYIYIYIYCNYKCKGLKCSFVLSERLNVFSLDILFFCFISLVLCSSLSLL